MPGKLKDRLKTQFTTGVTTGVTLCTSAGAKAAQGPSAVFGEELQGTAEEPIAGHLGQLAAAPRAHAIFKKLKFLKF